MTAFSRLEVRLAADTATLLDQMAAEQRTTRAALVRQLLETAVEGWMRDRTLKRLALASVLQGRSEND